jgi:hypothetical protein
MAFKIKIITAAQGNAERANQARLGVSVSKATFCIGLAELGRLSTEDCIAAAKGEWPDNFKDFLAYLTPPQARNAQTLWAASADIMRMDSTILALAWWFDISDAELDIIFQIDLTNT